MFHFSRFDLLYGALSSFFIIPGFIFLYRQTPHRKLVAALVGMVVFVYLFFSFATTKMPAYPIIAALPVFVAFAALLNYIGIWFKKGIVNNTLQRIIFIAIVAGFMLVRFDFATFREHHTGYEDVHSYPSMLFHNREIFRHLELPANTVIFNVKGRHFIEAMFYTGLPAYSMMPDERQYLAIKQKGYRIALFTAGAGDLPQWIAEDSSVIFINSELRGYD
jgi:4-amino-4-deoxy-L-arabinose transferase